MATTDKAKIKVKSGPQAPPPYLGVAKGSVITNAAQNTTSLDRSLYARNSRDMAEAVANLCKVSPDLSQAVATKIATTTSKNYTVVAYDAVGRISVPGTEAAQLLSAHWDRESPDYTIFNRSTDIRSVSASLLLDSFRYGGMLAELVLDKARLPAFIKPVDTSQIKWADNKTTSYPIYKTKQDSEVHLNYPTIFYSATQQTGETPYAESPLQTAIQPSMWDVEFADTLRRAAVKNLLQRLTITIDSEAWMKTLPMEDQYDATKLAEKAAETVALLEEQLSNLSPEDSLVLFDTIKADDISNANRSEDRSIAVLQALISGQLSSGAKILPSIIGRGETSANGSTESLLFLKSMTAAQNELNLMFSRIFTLAVKLMGQDVNVKFEFAPVDLRPEIELESFAAIKQSRLLKDLSLGLRTDEEVSILLTGTLPPVGYAPLSGTMFYENNNLDDATGGNNYSNTSVGTPGNSNSTQSTKDTQADEKGTPGTNS